MNEKLLITLGPVSLNEKIIREIDSNNDIYLFRINLSHTKVEDVEFLINTIRKYTDTEICLDSEGAQLRNQSMVNEKVTFTEGDEVHIHKKPIVGDSNNISFTPLGITDHFSVGDIVNVDFNSVSLKVTSADNTDYLTATVLSGGTVGSNKASDINADIPLPPITPKDIKAFEIGKKMGIKNFSLSFTNSRSDVLKLREIVGDANIISKIETLKALGNIEEIVEEANEILIDRGDLSRQVPVQKIPLIQRRLVSFCRSREVAVYVATNLLETMVLSKNPTRAEVNDVISTLIMGANGLVLAGETAIGSYPAEVAAMASTLINEFRRWTPHSTFDEILYDKDT